MHERKRKIADIANYDAIAIGVGSGGFAAPADGVRHRRLFELPLCPFLRRLGAAAGGTRSRPAPPGRAARGSEEGLSVLIGARDCTVAHSPPVARSAAGLRLTGSVLRSTAVFG